MTSIKHFAQLSCALFLVLSLAACGSDLTHSEAPAEALAPQATFGAYSVDVVKTNEWDRGFQGALVLKNKNGAAVKSFEITFKLKGNNAISKSWGGNFSAPKNGVITVTSPSYLKLNGLGKGASFESGFVAGGTFAGGTVVGLKVNGKKVGGGTTDPVDPVDPTEPGCRNPNSAIPRTIRLHTVLSTSIPRSSFSSQTRWYRENGTTQTFRLLDGDQNRATDRPNPRVEAFTDQWKATNANDWKEFSADYEIVKVSGSHSIFQMKSRDVDVQWEIMFNLLENGDILMNHRRNQDEVVARNMKGKTFNLRVRDNGRRYQVFYNCTKIADRPHQMDPSGNTLYTWRWGLYLGNPQKNPDLKQVGNAEIRVKNVRVR